MSIKHVKYTELPNVVLSKLELIDWTPYCRREVKVPMFDCTYVIKSYGHSYVDVERIEDKLIQSCVTQELLDLISRDKVDKEILTTVKQMIISKYNCTVADYFKYWEKFRNEVF